MRRRVLAISAFAAAHFVACIILALLFLSIPAKERLDIGLQDRVSGWLLSVLTFPVRDCVNYFKGYGDRWLYEPMGFLVLAGASVSWGLALYHSAGWLRARVRRHNRSSEMTLR
jgi:hypothetical protein